MWHNVRERTILTSASNEDSNQPAHPRSLMTLRCSHEEILYPMLSKLRPVKILIRLRECAADLNLRWAQIFEGTSSDIAAHIPVEVVAL